MTTKELAQRFVETVLSNGDLDRSLFTAGATGWHNSDGVRARLADAPDDAMKTLFLALEDVGPRDVRINSWEDGFVIRFVMAATLPNGGQLSAPSCVVCNVVDGRIDSIEEYLDPSHYAGVAAALAGGRQ